MPELQRLRADHGQAILTFELANRAYFAERHDALLAEQEAGISAFYALVAEDGSVLGRFALGLASMSSRMQPPCSGTGSPNMSPVVG